MLCKPGNVQFCLPTIQHQPTEVVQFSPIDPYKRPGKEEVWKLREWESKGRKDYSEFVKLKHYLLCSTVAGSFQLIFNPCSHFSGELMASFSSSVSSHYHPLHCGKSYCLFTIHSFKETELKLAASGTSLPMDRIQIGSATGGGSAHIRRFWLCASVILVPGRQSSRSRNIQPGQMFTSRVVSWLNTSLKERLSEHHVYLL